MVRRGTDTFRDLLDVEVVERLLAAPARRPMVRLVRGGAPVPFGEYTTSLRLGGLLVDDVVDVSRVMRLIADGATVVLQSLQHSWPPIGRFCAALQAEVAHPVQANCYLTPPGSTALARHADGHEVVVLQLEGSKTWSVDGLGELELTPGDVMYIPRGTSHQAAAQDRLSLHLTIGILATTYRSVLHRTIDDLPEEFDRPLPLGLASCPEGSDRVRTQLEAALAQVSELNPDDLVERQMRRAASSRRVIPTRHLRALLDDRAIDQHTWIQADPRLVVTSADRRLVLRLGALRLNVPDRIGPAVEALASGVPVAVGALPQLDSPSRLVLARRLVRESLAYVVEAPSRPSGSALAVANDHHAVEGSSRSAAR